jgi:hypothetical protein
MSDDLDAPTDAVFEGQQDEKAPRPGREPQPR